MIDTAISTISREEIPGSVGKKWGVTGSAAVHEGFVEADVKVEYAPHSRDRSRVLARAHELGHVSIAQDYVDGIPSESLAWESYRGMPVFENEVEAWLHGIEAEFGGRIPTQLDVELILDCLNSYRRGKNATDEQWAQALEVIADYYVGPKSHVFDYQPLEPEIGEEPPSCGTGVVGPAPEDHEDGDSPSTGHEHSRPAPASEDDDEDDEVGNSGEAGNPNEDYGDLSGEFDSGWNVQEALDELLQGSSPRRVADRYGLDVDRMPPLARAIWGGE